MASSKVIRHLGGLGRGFTSASNTLAFPLRLRVERLVEAQAVGRGVRSDAAIRVSLSDELLPAGVNQETDEVRSHVVAGKVGQHLGQVRLVQVDVHEQQAVKVLVGLDDQAAVGAVDAGVAVVRGGVGLGLDALGGGLLEALDAEALEGGEGPGARLVGVGRRDEVGRGVGVVGRGIRGDLALDARVDGPGGDVDLLPLAQVQGLEEGVHVLPAVELAQPSELRLGDGLEGVAGAIAVDELLDVGGLDLAAVVDDVSLWVDEGLGEVQGGVVDLGEAKRDVDLVIAGCAADTAHLLRVDGKGVLAVLLQHGEGLEVVDLPHPVRVSRDPCRCVSG